MSEDHSTETHVSRRSFVAGAAAILGAAVAPSIVSPSKAEAAPAHELPWAYTKQNAETLARRAYETYYQQGGCAEATWWPLVEALAADVTNADQALWASLPKKMFAYGGGGVNGWGTVCGTLNGSSAIVKMLGAPGEIIDSNMQYYAETPLPTNGIDNAVRAGWTQAAGVAAPLPNVPTCIGHTQLCHASISQWTTMTGFADGGREQKDRCAKACYDLMKHTVTLLNAWADDANAKPVVALDPSVAACSSCHDPKSKVAMKSKMACDPCHDQTTDHNQ